MFSGAHRFSVHGGQHSNVGRDMSQGVVVHINYPQGGDMITPRAAVPPVVLQNTVDAPREPRTNVDLGPLLPATCRAANTKRGI